MEKTKNIALVAHDNRKKDLVEWVSWNCRTLIRHGLVCTGTTGSLIEQTLQKTVACGERPPAGIRVTRLKSGPLGGDQQMGAITPRARSI